MVIKVGQTWKHKTLNRYIEIVDGGNLFYFDGKVENKFLIKYNGMLHTVKYNLIENNFLLFQEMKISAGVKKHGDTWAAAVYPTLNLFFQHIETAQRDYEIMINHGKWKKWLKEKNYRR